MERTLNQLASHAPYVLICLNLFLVVVWRSPLTYLSNSDSFNILRQKLRVNCLATHMFLSKMSLHVETTPEEN